MVEEPTEANRRDDCGVDDERVEVEGHAELGQPELGGGREGLRAGAAALTRQASAKKGARRARWDARTRPPPSQGARVSNLTRYLARYSTCSCRLIESMTLMARLPRSSCNPALGMLLKFSRSPFGRVSSSAFSTSPPSALLASHNRRDWCTDELGGRAPIQSASQGSNALRRRCGNKFSVDAQKRCAGRQ